MELATLDELADGRIIAGFGAGVRAWMEQMTLDYAKPLSAMRDAVLILRELLRGDKSSYVGKMFQLHDVQLAFPSRGDMQIYIGAEGPKALELSGEVSDGVLISVLAGPSYLQFARERVNASAARACRAPSDVPIITYMLYSVDDDSRTAKDAVREAVALYTGAEGPKPLTLFSGVSPELIQTLNTEIGKGRIATELVTDADVGQARRGRHSRTNAHDACKSWLTPVRTDWSSCLSSRATPRA